MSDFKVKLALKIIGDHFGNIVRDVAKVMTEGDCCTLAHLVRTNNAHRVVNSAPGFVTLVESCVRQKLDPATVREAMLILHQHGCLIVEMPAETGQSGEEQQAAELAQSTPVAAEVPGGGKVTGCLYRLHYVNILNRVRLPRLLLTVRQKFLAREGAAQAAAAVAVMEAALLRGKERKENIVRMAAAQLNIDQGEAMTAFESLVQDRFLIVVAPLEAKRRLNAEKQNTRAGRKAAPTVGNALSAQAITAASVAAAAGSKRSAATMAGGGRGNRGVLASLKAVGGDESGVPVELRKMLGAAIAGDLDAKAVVNQGTAVRVTKDEEDAEWEDPSAPKKKGKTNSLKRGRGEEEGEKEGAYPAPQKAKTHVPMPCTLWRIGWDQLLRECRHAACVDTVAQLHEGLAGNVVRVMLELGMTADHSGQSEAGPDQIGSDGCVAEPATQGKSAEVSVTQIHAQLQREAREALAGGLQATKVDVGSLKKLLEYLRLSESAAVVKVVGSEAEMGGPSYMVNMRGLMQSLQRRTVFAIACERFGFVSARIVELLQRHSHLEQQQVSDMAILPARETRERLYKLFIDKWVQYVELSKRGDFNATSSFYFWYLDLPQLKRSIRAHLYQSMYNLSVRRSHEADKGRDLLEKVAAVGVGGEQALDNDLDRTRHGVLMSRLNKLDLAVLKADSTLMLMESF